LYAHNGDEQKLLTLKRKILKKLYGPTLNPESGNYERRKNEEIERIFNRPNMQKFLKAKRLEWAGHSLGVTRIEGWK